MRIDEPRARFGQKARLAAILGLMFAVSHHASAQVVHGKIIDSLTKAPVTRMVVVLVDSLDTPTSRGTYTDSLGLYTLVAPRPGTYSVQIRRIGYEAKFTDTFLVPGRDTVIQNISARTTSQMLAAVETKSTSIRDAERFEFESRMKSGFGKVFDRDKILAEGWLTVKDALFQGAPGLFISRASGENQNQVNQHEGLYDGIRWRNCTSFAFFRNGVMMANASKPDSLRRNSAMRGGDAGTTRDGKGSPVPTAYSPTDVSELNDLMTISADWLYGIEMYAGITEIPIAYKSASRGYCGVIAYWTRPP